MDTIPGMLRFFLGIMWLGIGGAMILQGVHAVWGTLK